MGKDLKLSVNVSIGEGWHFGYGEQTFTLEAPKNALQSFAFNCGDVMQALVVKAFLQGEQELAAKDEVEDGSDIN